MEFITRSESPLAVFLRNLAPQILVLSPAMLMLRSISFDHLPAIGILKTFMLLILIVFWGHMAWTNAAHYSAQTFAPLRHLVRNRPRSPVFPSDREPGALHLIWTHTGRLWKVDRRRCLHLLVTPLAIASGLAIVLATAWNAAALISRSP